MRIDYSPGALSVIRALQAIQEPNESVWDDRALLAIAALAPTSALAHALHRPQVWPREFRVQLRQRAPTSRTGFNLPDFLDAVEAAAAADGVTAVRETHIARALAAVSPKGLQDLGVSVEAMVAETIERERDRVAPAAPRRARALGSARGALLDPLLDALDFKDLLQREERTGTVERKRTVFNRQGNVLADQEKCAVALVNGNPGDVPVFMIFGQEDDKTIVGEVDRDLKPLSDQDVQESQRRFDQRMQECAPPVPVRWRDYVKDGKRVWFACMFGRARGFPVMTTAGAYPYRSGEDTYSATPPQIAAWSREPLEGESQEVPEQAEPTPTEEAGPPAVEDSERVRQRKAITALEDAVQAFYQSPPAIPNQIQEDRNRSLEPWEPVYGPILEHFRPAMEEVVAAGLASSDENLERIARGLRTIFRLESPRSGLSWIVDAPRLVTRLIADRLMTANYLAERWERIPRIGRPPFESYSGRMPWVIAPEYRHPGTLANHADTAHKLSLKEITDHLDDVARLGVKQAQVEAAYAAVSVGLGVATMARDEAASGTGGPVWAWMPGVWSEIENWEVEPALLDAFAELAGEDAEAFRAELPRRVQGLVASWHNVGLWLDMPQRVRAALKEIADQANRDPGRS